MRKEGKPCGNKTPPQKTMHQKKKMAAARQLCSSLQDDPAKSETLLTESLHEDVEIFMDMMKSFGNLSSLVPLDPVDPSAPENIPFWWKWNQMPSLIL
jgi:hypothetical protein